MLINSPKPNYFQKKRPPYISSSLVLKFATPFSTFWRRHWLRYLALAAIPKVEIRIECNSKSTILTFHQNVH
ncbi:hypothetical protein BpHYR1_036247 [Brachionus plicatilis]|uniref:Uncharacterized protein n=1 Tax=Brachionus plicatilis TaxID=10195 RepID=A0A3M7RGS7_BRAPC|nr:hypothetical protein BpHYR1_036247 [Brachionus plicatilis]